ncbi:MAG TPA: hypothetical protein VFH66_15195 [Mycobacteriales bacterium]|nr:hypothetical protein [Mycobacteriales bacterium]
MPQSEECESADAVSGERATFSRRGFLSAGALGIAGLALPEAVWLPASAAEAVAGFDGVPPVRAAMHVHGSWSEGNGSWEAQFRQAVRNQVDLLYMTDHDTRVLAMHYLRTLVGAKWLRTSQGRLLRHAMTVDGGSVRLLAESAAVAAAASVTMAIDPAPMGQAARRLHTSIAGQTLVLTFGAVRLTHGARFDVHVPLSYHPAAGDRAAGQLELVYRFGRPARRRYLQRSGRRAVVELPTPTSNSIRRLSPARDAASFWPAIFPADNVMAGLSLCATSPHRGAVADIRVEGLRFARTQNTPTAAADQQAHLAAWYQSKFPSLTVRPSIEVSHYLPDLNPFGIPQYIPDYATLPSDLDALKAQIVSNVHAQGGLVSWNHPFGYSAGPLASPDQQTVLRRQLFGNMRAVHEYGVDILEVGYALRGHVGTAAHLDLWDTFSRTGRFLTGNGVTDDHEGRAWGQFGNGFVTGIWTSSRSDADVVQSLAGGRAYLSHMQWWPGGEIDLLVDDKLQMGSVSVGSSAATRKLTVLATSLPAGGAVQVVGGPVDYSDAPDPGTAIASTLPVSQFSGNTATVQIDASSSCFYRVQVLNADGVIVGSSNPVWLLTSDPPSGAPATRRHDL